MALEYWILAYLAVGLLMSRMARGGSRLRLDLYSIAADITIVLLWPLFLVFAIIGTVKVLNQVRKGGPNGR